MTVAGAQYTMPAYGPAALVHGINVYYAGDEDPLTVPLTNGQATITLYSSNLAGDQATLKAKVCDDGNPTSKGPFMFNAPEVQTAFFDAETLELVSGDLFLNAPYYFVSLTTMNSVAVTGHSVILVPGRIDLANGGGSHYLDSNSDGSISSAEISEMAEYLTFSPQSAQYTDSYGEAVGELMVDLACVERVYLWYFDLDIWSQQ